ncbi:MAG: SDR family oxidoreductase [Bacillota bacterium]
MKLNDKVAVVTGAASGMGKEIIKLFAKEGAKVVAADIDLENLEKIVEVIKAKGGTALAVECDIAKQKDVENVIDTAVKEFGTLDILINNAGIMDNFVPAANLTDELWDKIISVNLTGTMRMTRKALAVFLPKERGIIVNVASVAGLYGSRAGAAYTASKHAIIGLTRNIGFQYAKTGIRCNAIAPGGVNTNIGRSMANPDPFGMDAAMAGASSNPRSGEPEEIATIALFLASDDASFVNGNIIVADAGWTAY